MSEKLSQVEASKLVYAYERVKHLSWMLALTKRPQVTAARKKLDAADRRFRRIIERLVDSEGL